MAPPRQRLGVLVTAAVTMDVTEAATIALQLAVAGERPSDETLVVTVDGVPVEVEELATPVGGRQHVLLAHPGRLEIRYAATAPAVPVSGQGVSTTERIEATRPSRYCPSDRVLGLAAQFREKSGGQSGGQSDGQSGGQSGAAATMRAICDHVATRTAYAPGSSGVSTDGVETLLAGQGVCRDYAHAVAMLGRAAGVPTRVAAVYAPGLSPMDMHAVVEAAVDGVWRVYDATGLAPRRSLARIATGRDAADTAFLSVLDGRADLVSLEVSAVYDGDLPTDDREELVSLP